MSRRNAAFPIIIIVSTALSAIQTISSLLQQQGVLLPQNSLLFFSPIQPQLLVLQVKQLLDQIRHQARFLEIRSNSETAQKRVAKELDQGQTRLRHECGGELGDAFPEIDEFLRVGFINMLCADLHVVEVFEVEGVAGRNSEGAEAGDARSGCRAEGKNRACCCLLLVF